MRNLKLQTLGIAAALALGSIAMTGCTTTTADSHASTRSARSAIDSNANATLARLYNTVPGSRELVQKAAGVLVFPSVTGGSFVVGAEYGRGVLLVGGRPASYYSTTAGSVGFQAGGQSKAVIYVFNNQESLDQFRNSRGWTVGADATVTVATMGANASVNSYTVQQPIVGYVLTNVGLEAGASVKGAKISRIEP
ncbi:MAG: twin-arginine translocation pathway signal [Burkholderiaceae bacterium]|nr:twin-arginine translocation pathway signal [Burkholderiaceae bacterium]